MKKLLLTLTLLLGLGFAANAETWSYTVVKGSYGKHNLTQITVGQESDIVFNVGEDNEMTWKILIEAIDDNNKPSISNDGTEPAGISIGAAAKPAKTITLSTDEFAGYNISNVAVTVRGGAALADFTATAKVAGTDYGSKAIKGKDKVDLEWTPNAQGNLDIEFVNNITAVGKSKNAPLVICSIAVTYTTGPVVEPNVATPVISVEEGKDATNFIGSIDATVSVTPAEGQNLTLKYTLDGSAPAADNGTVVENNGVVTVTENCTLKVIAIDDATNETSAVASKTFNKFEGQVGIAGLVNVLVEDNVTDQKQAKTYDVFLDNAVVIFVDGANAYIQDADASILMYKYSHGYKAGDVLNGVASIKGFMYQGLPEIVSVSGAVKTTGGEIPEALEMTIAEVNAMSDPAVYSRLITIKGVYPQSSEEDGSRNVVFEKDGESIALHAQYTDLFPDDLDVNRAYNIAGFLANYKGTKQINFSKAERIELLPDDRKDPALDFAEASISLDLNDMEELSTLGLTMAEGFDGEIVWASDNADAVAVEDGYYLVYGLGNATLTASFAGNREWKASEAALNVTVETKVLGISYAMAGGFKAIDLEYTVHVKNHAEGSSYKLVLTVDGEAQDAIELDAPVAVDNAAGAPARAANKGTSGSSEGATHSISGTCKIPFESEIDNTVAHTIKMAVHMNDAATALYETEEISQRTTTGIEDVAVDAEQAAPEYYTLQGVRVAQPEAGQIYIVRRGADVAKELVK